ncbi:MAG: hypothetical protein HQ541_17955 [Mariniphaga sp.]|nr:hypothetical protein [Mariniphaga sp.]
MKTETIKKGNGLVNRINKIQEYLKTAKCMRDEGVSIHLQSVVYGKVEISDDVKKEVFDIIEADLSNKLIETESELNNL